MEAALGNSARFFSKHRNTHTKIDKNTKTHSRLENLKHISNTDGSERNHKKSYDFSAMQHALNWKPTEKPMIF